MSWWLRARDATIPSNSCKPKRCGGRPHGCFSWTGKTAEGREENERKEKKWKGKEGRTEPLPNSRLQIAASDNSKRTIPLRRRGTERPSVQCRPSPLKTGPSGTSREGSQKRVQTAQSCSNQLLAASCCMSISISFSFRLSSGTFSSRSLAEFLEPATLTVGLQCGPPNAKN